MRKLVLALTIAALTGTAAIADDYSDCPHNVDIATYVECVVKQPRPAPFVPSTPRIDTPTFVAPSSTHCVSRCTTYGGETICNTSCY